MKSIVLTKSELIGALHNFNPALNLSNFLPFNSPEHTLTFYGHSLYFKLIELFDQNNLTDPKQSAATFIYNLPLYTPR